MNKQIINQTINAFWTLLCGMPMGLYWYINYNGWLYVFLSFGFVVFCLPTGFLRRLQLSSDKKFYERLGVRFVQKLVQNSSLFGRVDDKNSQPQKVIKHHADASRYLGTAIMFLRFHLLCFVFFLLSMAYAVINGQYVWAGMIILVNIVYNVFSLLLQQCNWLRITRLSGQKKLNTRAASVKT